MKIINGHLSVIIPVDLSFIKPHLNNLDRYLVLVKNICNDTVVFKDPECENIIQPLEVRYADMIRDYDAISHLLTRRIKRSAWFGAVGTVFKHLFGTMNEDDAMRYNDAIQSVQKDQKQLANFIKQNILITNSTLTAFNESVNLLISNEKSLNRAIDSLSENIKKLTIISAEVTIKTKFMEIITIVENSILTLSFKIEDLANGLMFSRGNILYPAICSPKDILDELVKNHIYIPSSKEFPIDLTIENVHILVESSSISTYLLNENLIFVVKIPLVNPIEFNIYNVLPLPVPQNNNSYITILPSAKTIGFTRDKNQYCHIDNISTCKNINQYYICKDINIMSSSAHPTCESEILYRTVNIIPESCEVKAIKGNINIWQKINNNKWIYVTSGKKKFTLDCDKNIQDTEIHKTGIIQIPIGCIGYCQGVQLQPKQNFFINISHINLNFNIIKMNLNLPVISLNGSHFENKYPNFKYLIDFKEYINNLNNDIQEFINKPIRNPHESYYISFIMCVITIIFIFLVYKLYNAYKLCKHPTPCENPPDPDSQDNVSSLSETPRPRIFT